MNLKLKQVGTVHVLHVQGALATTDSAVLRAGISKLMRTGKDRIVLDLSSSSPLPEEIAKEVVELHRVTTELGGRIAVVVPEPAGGKLRAKLNGTGLPIVDSLEAAVRLCETPVATAAEETGALNTRDLLQERDARIRMLEGQLALQNPEALRLLRQENQSLRRQAAQLELQILSFAKERRLPPDAEAAKSRIESLENSVLELSQALEKGTHAKK